MSKTFAQGQVEVARLCRHFSTNREKFRAPDVKEAHIRQSLIEPFFISLGWDVGNTGLVAPQYRDVVPQDALNTEGQQRAPDYTFRVGSVPKFYVEAKPCGVNIGTDPAHAYQLRRYGWSAKLALSILTDFEELAVYNCTARPRPTDRASHARIQHYGFEEYPERWRELWDVFSREAVSSGTFDQYAASKRKRGTSEVDAEFLKEIESWREDLARNIVLRNKDLSSDDLNAAVQMTIDRVVFLRMAEARGLEPQEQLLKLCEQPDIYPRFLRNPCRKAGKKYHSGLFHFRKEEGISEAPDRITPKLTVDDKVFKPILESLYFAHGSPYDFGVMPVEILGTVYERFLGKVIRLTAGHQARIEEKPEVRKAGGVYYTPAYIVRYIVTQTVGQQIDGKSPAELAGGKGQPPFRVLDLACGSGSFLLGAYQCLLDHCLAWYTEHHSESFKEAVYKDPRGGQWRLTIEEKQRILTAHIFGVDVDRQAVEVSKLSLLLKALEGENDATLSRQSKLCENVRARPNLAENIKCGNSLVGSDYFAGRLTPEPGEMKQVNPFDWRTQFPDAMQDGGFDCIIGNPPYLRMETFKELKAYLRANFSCHDRRSDMYAYFIEKAHQTLKTGGRCGMIVSNKFLRANYGRPLKQFLRNSTALERVVDFAGLPVFQRATVRTIILLTSLPPRRAYEIFYSPPVSSEVFKVISGGSLPVEQAILQSTFRLSDSCLDAAIWSFASQETDQLLVRLQATHVPLKEYCAGQICMGVKSGLKGAFVIDANTRAAILKRNPKAIEIIKPFLNGREVRRYRIAPRGMYLIYAYHGVKISDFPAVLEYLRPFRADLERRTTKQAWYELQQPQYNFSGFMAGPKIIFPDMALKPRFALDELGFHCANTTYFIPRRDLYLLGLLNSRLGYCYFATKCAGLEGKNEKYLRFFGQYLEGFPVRRVDSTRRADKDSHGRMVTLVESMLSLQDQLAAAKSAANREIIQRQIDATDAKIDRLVYNLYGLTAEEIAVVEAVK